MDTSPRDRPGREPVRYAYLKTGRYSFIADGVRAFVRRNPRLLGRVPWAGGE